ASLLEERSFDPANEVLDRSLLPRSGGPADFDPDAEIERHAGEERIPLGDVPVTRPLQRYGLRSVEDGEERHAADRREMVDEGPHQRFRALIRHQRHLDPARVLQPAREEVHALLTPVEKADIHMAKIVL